VKARRTGRRYGVVMGTVVALLVVGAEDAYAVSGGADLSVSSVSAPPRAVTAGQSMSLRVTVADAGPRAAASAGVRFLLSSVPSASMKALRHGSAPPQDLVLLGRGLRVARVAAHRRRRARLHVTVPPSAPPGSYRLIACVDPQDVVRERREGDNCRLARRAIVVKPAAATAALRLDSFSDVLGPPDPALEATQLGAVRGSGRCRAHGSARPMSLRAAVRSIDRRLRRAAPKGMRALAASPAARSAAQAEAAAVSALVAKQPGAALAALIRAHALASSEPGPLINAAAVATGLGMAREALALLDAAQQRQSTYADPMGVSRQAALLANRGDALIALGRPRRAETVLDAALAVDPLLTEAAASLAIVAACDGDMARAARLREAARSRQPVRIPVRRTRGAKVPAKPVPEAPVRPDPPVDESQGQASELRSIPLPETPEQAVALYPVLVELGNALRGQVLDLGRQDEELVTEATGPDVLPLTAARRSALLSRVATRDTSPRVAELRAEADRLLAVAERDMYAHWCGDDGCTSATTAVTRYQEDALDACTGQDALQACAQSEFAARCIPGTRVAQTQWSADINRAYEAYRVAFREQSRQMSAVAANLSGPAYRAAVVRIQEAEAGLTLGIAQMGEYWSMHVADAREGCVEAPDQAASDQRAGEAGLSEPGSCPPGVKAFSASLDLEVVTFEVTCDELKLGAETPGWVGLFGELTWSPASRTMTVFAGVQAKVGAGGAKASAREGIYVVQSNTTLIQGDITDVGVRVTADTTFGAGPVSWSGPGVASSISLVGAAAP